MVQAERAQSESAREGQPEADFWRPIAHRFAAKPPHCSEPDPAVRAIRRRLRPTDHLLDVGAGGGRLAVPLAENCARVTAVEPSEGMRAQLAASIKESGARNIETVPANWAEARVECADVVLCSHVVYGVDDITPFVAKLQLKARRAVVIAMHARPPVWNFFPLWRLVHGETRRSLPALPEFLELLQSWRIRYELERLPESSLNRFSDFDEAVGYSMQRLCLAPGTEKSKRLPGILKEVLEEREGGLHFVWSRSLAPRLVIWSPDPPDVARVRGGPIPRTAS